MKLSSSVSDVATVGPGSNVLFEYPLPLHQDQRHGRILELLTTERHASELMLFIVGEPIV